MSIPPTFFDQDPIIQTQELAKFLTEIGATGLNVNVNKENQPKVLVDCTAQLQNVLDHKFETQEEFLNFFTTLILLVLHSPHLDSISKATDNISNLIKTNLDIPEKKMYSMVFALDILYKNLLPTEPTRLKVYDTILVGAMKSRAINLVNDPKKIDKWLQEFPENHAEKEQIWRKLAELNRMFGENKKAIECMTHLLETYTDKTASKSRKDAFDCIISIIQEPKILSMDHLLTLKAVQFLEGEPIFDLLQILISGDLSEFEAFASKNKKFLTDNKISEESCLKKLRTLCFMELANEKSELSFDKIAEVLKLSADEVEPFVVDVIHQNVVNCKINQVQNKISILSALPRSFGIKEWKKLQDNLGEWKGSLAQVKKHLLAMSNDGLVAN